jgi:hypothetical protein
MKFGEAGVHADPDPAEQAARQAIADDADDWRAHAALASVLTVRRRHQEAATAARRAVALAPAEPDAHLALADALLAVAPRGPRTRAAVSAELDQAELLGVPARDLAARRALTKGSGPSIVVMMLFLLSLFFWQLATHDVGGAIGRAASFSALVVVVAVSFDLRLRPPGRSLRDTLAVKRRLSRRRLATPDLVSQRAPLAATVLGILVLPTASLAIPGVDGHAPPPAAAWAALVGVPSAGVAVWIFLDRWLRPGTVIRVLRRDWFVASSVVVTFGLSVVTAWLSVRRVQRPGLWFTLYLVQMAWIVGNAVAGARIAAWRKKAAGQ